MSCPAVIHVHANLGLPKAVVVVTPGPTGPIGSRWLGGTAVPAASLGVIGDWYLRSNGDVYGPKTANGWGSVVFTLQPSLSAAPVQSVALTGPSGWSTSSTNTDGAVVLSFALPVGYGLPSTASQANWDAAYSERSRWDGGSTGLNAATGRASLQLGSAAQASTGDFATAAQGSLAASAVQPAALASKADLVGGLVPTSQIPAIAISEYLGSVNGQAAMLALVGQRGDWCIRLDRERAWILSADDASQLASWVELPSPAGGVTSVNGQAGVVVLGFGDVGAAASNDSRLSDAREWSAATVEQAEAEAGTATTRRAWTALRVRQAVAAWWAATGSTFGRNWAALADAAAGRTALGLGTAATAATGDFQPVDSDLTAIAALSTTAFGRSFLTLADDAAGRALIGAAPLYPIRQSVTAVAGVYTIDVTSGQEFITAAAINGATTINLSSLASLPANGVWRAVLRFRYTSGVISWFAGNTGYTVEWDGDVEPQWTAGQQEGVVIEVVGGQTVIEVAAQKGRS